MRYRGQHRPSTVHDERRNRVCPHPPRAWRQLPTVYVRCGWCRALISEREQWREHLRWQTALCEAVGLRA